VSDVEAESPHPGGAAEPPPAVPARDEGCRIVRRAIRAIDAEDWDGLGRLMRRSIRFRPLSGLGLEVSGRSRTVQALRALDRSDFAVHIDRVELLHDGRVLALGTVRLLGDSQRFAGIHEIRDGRIVAIRHLYSDGALLQQLGIVDREPA